MMGWFHPLNPPMRDWQGRRVWLVGASSGIGQATAAALHAQGARVILSARNTAALDRFVQQYPGSQAWPCDVTQADDVRQVAPALLAQGPLPRVRKPSRQQQHQATPGQWGR